jgi:hypothetical protein
MRPWNSILPSFSRTMLAVSLCACFLTGCAGMYNTPYLSFITVTPGVESLAMGETVQFKAMATYSNGTTGDVSNSVVWHTQDVSVAAVNTSGLASSVSAGRTLVTASESSVVGEAVLVISKAALKEISITSVSSLIFLGQTAQLHAAGTYSDKSVQDITDQVSWSAAQTGVAQVNSKGLVSPVAVGSTAVTGALNDISASSQITVAPAALLSIAVQGKNAALPLGTSEQLNALGTYTDGSTENLTSAVHWTSSSPGIINTSASGLATTRAVGNASIIATLSGISGATTLNVSTASLVSIAVSAAHSILPLGTVGQLTATGIYTDGSKNDLTQSATWTSSSPAVVAISSPGVVSARNIGAANVAASFSNITGKANLSISPAVLTGILVTLANTSIPVGNTVQLKATGTFTDGSTQDLTSSANWVSSSPAIASIRNPGVVTAVSIGATRLSAASGSIQGAADLNVSAATLSSLRLAPTGPTVPLGNSLQLAVTGTYSDGSTQDVTQQASWNIQSPTIAAVTAAGLATGQRVGTTGVTASLNGVAASDILTVQPLLSVAYFDATSGVDSTIRITNPAVTGEDLCTMIYVFDQAQQMSECCGCLVSQDGLLTLSLEKDLLSNPLTGVPSKSGTIMLVTADPAANPSCNASAVTPEGSAVAWSTHLFQSQSGQAASRIIPGTEDIFSSMPLNTTLSSALQAQCTFIQQLGSGQGVCGCSGHAN